MAILPYFCVLTEGKVNITMAWNTLGKRQTFVLFTGVFLRWLRPFSCQFLKSQNIQSIVMSVMTRIRCHRNCNVCTNTWRPYSVSYLPKNSHRLSRWLLHDWGAKNQHQNVLLHPFTRKKSLHAGVHHSILHFVPCVVHAQIMKLLLSMTLPFVRDTAVCYSM